MNITTTFISFSLVFLTMMQGGGGCNGGGSFANAFSFSPQSSSTNIVVSPLARHSPKTIPSVVVRRRQTTITISRAFTNDDDYATSELGSVIRPYYTKLMERLPTSSVLSAVEKYNGAPMVASDLAAAAGMSLGSARKELTVGHACRGRYSREYRWRINIYIPD